MKLFVLLSVACLMAACNFFALPPRTPTPIVVTVTAVAPTSTSIPTPSITSSPVPKATPTTARTATRTSASIIKVDGGWGHLTRDGGTGAFYALIHNTGTASDRLVGASSTSCSRVGLQDMTNPKGDDIPFSVNIPAGKDTELKFRGLRLLCYGIPKATRVGDSMPLTLNFEKFGKVAIQAEIRNPPP